jgi:hypothetical protein
MYLGISFKTMIWVYLYPHGYLGISMIPTNWYFHLLIWDTTFIISCVIMFISRYDIFLHCDWTMLTTKAQ